MGPPWAGGVPPFALNLLNLLNLLQGLGPPWAGGVPPFALNPVNVTSWGLPGPDLSLGPGKSPRGRVPERPCFLVVLRLRNCLFWSSGDQWCFYGFQKSMALALTLDFEYFRIHPGRGECHPLPVIL